MAAGLRGTPTMKGGTLLIIALLLPLGCGGGGDGRGGGAALLAPTGEFYLERCSAAGRTGVALDEELVLTFSQDVRPGSLSYDSVRIRTPEGRAPRGTLVRGVFLVDQATGNRVVIDPEQIGPRMLEKIERKGRADLVPLSIRLDLGAISPLNGSRRMLFDRSRKRKVTFVPDVPSLPDLSDAGFEPGTAYTVTLPVHPARNTVVSARREPLSPGPDGEIAAAFTTAALDDEAALLGGGAEGPFQLVNSKPVNCGGGIHADQRIMLRFSRPLDPRTVVTDHLKLRIASVPGYPEIPCSLFLRQTRIGLAEVVMTPLQDLPANAWFEVTATAGVRDLAGHALDPVVLSFDSSFPGPEPTTPLEGFDTNAREDAAVTTASWNDDVPGALVATFEPGGPRESFARSLWYNQYCATIHYGAPEVDLDANGGAIEIEVQGSSEDVSKSGIQPVDPDDDPGRLRTTDWLPVGEARRLSGYQYLRFRVFLTVAPDHAAGDPLPVVRQIRIPAGTGPL